MEDASPEMLSIFAGAIERPSPGERAAYLDTACGSDGELRRRIEALLRAHDEAGGFLSDGPVARDPVATLDLPTSEGPGSVVGPYKLLEQVGEGGFGVVFLAEQQQPVRRKVALKVLKPGMDTRQVVARFEAERQALALMDHPNIAHVFDGGTTASGRPYFVMELVKGLSITGYCDQARLTPRERLQLFASVCQAVQHAHQKGIIHRDLKPSNVLVTIHDGAPLVKVIDFGIAKALGQQLTDKTLFTGSAQMVGTPLYMSPEQAASGNGDIDTRSDVYSLGVLLYVLLTGTTPFDKERLKEVSYDEMRRIIREEEPPRPSTRIGALGQAATTLSAQRKSDPNRLSQLLRGELDWIVMKALEKDRGRRYESASAFAADVRHYLNEEPVLACPPSVGYRLWKFARRNRRRLVAAAVLGLALLIAAGGIGWAALDRAARQARAGNELALALDRAELFQGQGKRAEALAAFDRAKLLVREAPPDAARDGRLATLKERLDAEARDEEFRARFEKIRLGEQSRVDVKASQFDMGTAFPKIRDALDRYGITIGATPPAEAAALIQGRPKPVHGDLVAALDECLNWAPTKEARTRQWLLATLKAADNDLWRVRVRQAWFAGDWDALEPLARWAHVQKQPPSFLLLTAIRLPARMKATRLELLRRIQRAYSDDLWANVRLGLELMQNGQPAEAVRYYTAALALRRDNPGIYLNRGNALHEIREVDAAIADYRQALALAPRYFAAHFNLGRALYDKGRVDEAIAEFRKAIGIDKDHAKAHFGLGCVLEAAGRADDAIACYREAIRLKNLEKEDRAKAHNNLGQILYHQGKRAEATVEFRQAIASDPCDSRAHNSLGIALGAQGKWAEAIREYRLAIDLDPRNDEAHYNLGIALDAQGERTEAIREFRLVISITPKHAKAHYHLGYALKAQGKLADAINAYRQAVVLDPKNALARVLLGQGLLAQGRFAEARQVVRPCLELLPPKDTFRPGVARMLAHCEQALALERKLTAILKGQGKADSPAEQLQLAWLCQHPDRKRYAAAADFYAAAFAARPHFAEELRAGHRYTAARAAALAGCGVGQDADKLEDKERARLRRQALDWLRADLQAWERLLDSEPDKSGSVAQVTGVLRHWLADSDLAGVRDPEGLARLPDAERQLWQRLWNSVADTLVRAQAKAPPMKGSDVK